MNDLIKERDERTERRKKFKKKVDSMFNLSYKDEKTIKLSTDVQKLSDTKIRLLDEGAIVGDDYIDFIIKKGTLEKFYNGQNEYLPNLDESFVGSVNLGHMDFATFPFIIGEWTKNDLSLVEIDDERKGIDVELRLDSESVFVRELQRQPYDIGISSEFYYHVDWESTDAVGYMVVDEVYIFAYGLVGECGNVNSSGLELKGETKMTKEQLEELKAKNLIEDSEEDIELSAETEETVEEQVEELAEEVEETEDVAEESAEEAEEEPEIELSAEETEESEEEDVEEAELSAGEEAVSEESEETEEAESEEATFEEVEAYINELVGEIEQLKAENAELKKTNKRLNKKLKAELAKKEQFVGKFKSVAESIGVEDAPKHEKATEDYIFGDGIGD